ncbi:MAG: hypothetical protein KGH55_03450 [Nanoarchaeota archaeon]|nr:hypothetical protein [Nanoarchaeota archaeon]
MATEQVLEQTDEEFDEDNQKEFMKSMTPEQFKRYYIGYALISNHDQYSAFTEKMFLELYKRKLSTKEFLQLISLRIRFQKVLFG